MSWVRDWRLAVNVLLSGAALLGVACLIAMVFLPLCGLKPLVVRSGSMAPAIDTGAMAWVRDVDATEVRVNDVVVVQREHTRVMHRVIDIEETAGAARKLQLRGDANSFPDAGPDEVLTVERVAFHVPWIGRAVVAATNPPGSLVLGAYLAGCVWLILRPRSSQRAGVGGAHRDSRGLEPGDDHAGAREPD